MLWNWDVWEVNVGWQLDIGLGKSRSTSWSVKESGEVCPEMVWTYWAKWVHEAGMEGEDQIRFGWMDGVRKALNNRGLTLEQARMTTW